MLVVSLRGARTVYHGVFVGYHRDWLVTELVPFPTYVKITNLNSFASKNGLKLSASEKHLAYRYGFIVVTENLREKA